MKPHSSSRRTSASQTRPPLPPPAPSVTLENDFADLAGAEQIVEHLTVPGFLRRIPHRWHLDEVARFGDKVGRVAESMQLAYLTTVDRSLGVIRMFPSPLLKRVYEVLSQQFGWPQIIDLEPAQLEDGKRDRETLRSLEKSQRCLRELADASENPDVLEALARVNTWVEAQTALLRVKMGDSKA